MIINGDLTQFIKERVANVKKLFVGQADKEQKGSSMPCLTKTVKPALENHSIIKAGVILFVALVLSRLLPLPPNSEPLLGLAVLVPYLTNSKMAMLIMPAIMFVSDLFLGFGEWIWFTYTALALAPIISVYLSNKYMALSASWLLWHILANTGQWYQPFSVEALLFDIRFLGSGLFVVILYDAIQKVYQTNLSYNK